MADSTPTWTCPVRYRTRHGWTTCDTPTKDVICHACARDAEARLAAVPALLVDLQTTIARQAAGGSGGGGRGKSRPLPYDPDAGLARDSLRRAAAALAGIIRTLRTNPDSPARIRALDDAVRDATRHVDRPDDRIRILCPCGARVALPHDPDEIARCHSCGEYGVRSWWVTHAAPDPTPVTLPNLPVALLAYGWTLTHEQLRKWADRGQITESGRDARGRRLYDVAAVAATAAHRLR